MKGKDNSTPLIAIYEVLLILFENFVDDDISKYYNCQYGTSEIELEIKAVLRKK